MHRLLKKISLLGILVALTVPGISDDFVRQEGELTSIGKPVERADDPVYQAVRREGPTTALIVVMEFSETEAQLKDTQLATVPSNVNRQGPDDFTHINYVRVTAVDAAGNSVGEAFIPEQRIRIKENAGIVRSESQTSTFAIPLSGSPVSLKVSGTMLAREAVTISIAEIMKDLCESYPGDPACRKVSPGGTELHVD